jgi:hypothetical protein
LPPRPAHEDEYLGKKLFERDGVRRCLYCHTTNFRAVLDQVGPEAADHAIGCERCHGPGGHHVVAVDAGFSDLAIAHPDEASAPEINKLCGQCHSIHRPEILTAARTDPIWYRFQAQSLTWSRCFTASDGKLSCVTCHDPHRGAETSVARIEAKCLTCHGAEPVSAGPVVSSAASPPTKTSPGQPAAREPKTPCPVNPAQGCLECHMPRAWQQGTHSFKTDHFIRVHGRIPSEN